MYHLMDSARQAEVCTKQPSRMYIDKVDSVLKAIKGPDWLANDHEQSATTFLGLTAKFGLQLYVQDVLKNDLLTRERKSAINHKFCPLVCCECRAGEVLALLFGE